MGKTLLIMVLLATTGLSSCGVSISTSSKASIKLRMHGVYTDPTDASGNSAPRSQTYIFKSFNLINTDGSSTSLYTGSPETIKIIDRGQIVYNLTDASTYAGKTFTGVLVQFDPAVTVVSKNGHSNNLTLNSGDISHTETFTVTKGKETDMTIDVDWGSTVNIADDGSESVSAPTFVLSYDAN